MLPFRKDIDAQFPLLCPYCGETKSFCRIRISRLMVNSAGNKSYNAQNTTTQVIYCCGNINCGKAVDTDVERAAIIKH